MKEFDIIKIFLLTKEEEKIKAIESFYNDLDRLSKRDLICEVFNSFYTENKLYKKNEGVCYFRDNKFSLENIIILENNENKNVRADISLKLLDILELNTNEEFDLYEDKAIINFIEQLFNSISDNDKANFIKHIKNLKLSIKNTVSYYNVNLLQFFNFPNKREKDSNEREMFFNFWQKFITDNYELILEANIEDEILIVDNFRCDNINITSKDSRMSFFEKFYRECKNEYSKEKLLNFYLNNRLSISDRESYLITNNKKPTGGFSGKLKVRNLS